MFVVVALEGSVAGMCLMCEMEQHVRRCFENSGSIVKPQSILQMLKGMCLYCLV